MIATLEPRARRNETLIRSSLARIGQVNVATAMGVAESQVSRFKNGVVTEMAAFLAAIGLKVVKQEFRCLDPEKNQALLTFAKAYLEGIERPEQLGEEDPE